jgi:microcystin-dependent protein
MSRNGSGTYAVPNTMVAGEVITAAGHNENYSDLGSEITNSVAADGQTTMTGPLKASSGAVGTPGITFSSDTDSGLYRIGANNIGVAVNGAKVLDVATTGLTVTGIVNGTTIKQAGFALLPVGLGPLPWTGLAAPAGWVAAYGQALSRTTYAALWAFAQVEIGLGSTIYGVGDGSTTFTVADMRGRVVAGADSIGGVAAGRLTVAVSGFGDSVGDVGGGQVTALVTENLPPYTPSGTITDGPINSTFTSTTGQVLLNNTVGGAGNFTAGGLASQASAGTVASSQSGSTFAGTPQGGVSTAFTIVQPTIVTNFIIFAGV